MPALPQPEAAALAHSQKLTNLIHAEIAGAGGSLSFARFMELALYAPGLGYYSAGSHKLGKMGDFTTAPEISPLFAHCIARQCREILSALSKPAILEIGAGSGQLAFDLLSELAHFNDLTATYFILEISADLRARQQQLLQRLPPDLYSRIHWLDTLPEDFCGIILANEVMDALPVHCFTIKNNFPYERSVKSVADHFAWHDREPEEPLATALQSLYQNYELQEGYISEINLLLGPWLASLAHSLKQGVILLFDYGYDRRGFYHPERGQGTLQCYFQHHRHENPFTLVGLQDITAHVDFTRVAENADDAGLKVAGYTTQAAFLLACGLLDLAQTDLPPEVLYRQNQAIKTLTLPAQMGELVKVIALTRDVEFPLLGFTMYDRRRDL
jgi:SAM-dependent MidA family methyltransferase